MDFTSLSNSETTNIVNAKLNKLWKEQISDNLTINAISIDRDIKDPAFKKQLKSMTLHKTRYISGNISFLLYGAPKNIPYESFLTKHYGHQNPESTKSYLGINIKFADQPKNNNIKIPHGGLLAIIKQYEAKMDNIQQQEKKKKEKTRKASLLEDLAKKIGEPKYQELLKITSKATPLQKDLVAKVVDCVKWLNDNKVKFTQKQLRALLRIDMKSLQSILNS
jgi:hypothetical protein